MYVLHLFPLVLLFLETVCCQEEHNTNFDIVFLLDQKRTNLTLLGSQVKPDLCRMRNIPYCHRTIDFFEWNSNYKLAYEGVKEWVQSLFDKNGSTDARFSVIFSCDGKTSGLMHDINGSIVEEMTLNLLEEGKNGIKAGCGKNFAWMMNLAIKKVFTAEGGHRPSAAAVAIVVSDCVREKLSPSEVNKAVTEFNYFFHTIKGQVYFVCYVEFSGGDYRDYYKAGIEQFMNETLELLHTNNQTNRSMIYLDGSIVNVGQRLSQLLPNRTRIANVNCSQTWMCGFCSGKGTCFALCNWTTHTWPTGNGTNCTEQAQTFQNCTCPTTTPTEQPPSYWSIILGIGILLLAVVGVVIGVCCFRAINSRKKRTKNKAVAVQKSTEKKEGIAVHLSMEHSTAKGSNGNAASMKGLMVKSRSKSGSVVPGPLSKPADESGKSVSKSKGEVSKSKTSKSIARKNVKSIGISKKSVASKSLSGKQLMKGKKQATN